MKNFFPMLLVFILIGCADQSSETIIENDTIITEQVKYVTSGEDKTLAKLSIDGMTCPMGCAKMIENKLASMDGVISCEVAFEDKIASVEYDHNVVSEQDMIGLVHAMVDGQYKVNTVEIEKIIVKEKEREDEVVSKSGPSAVEKVRSLGNISFPNIFDVFVKRLSL